MAEQTPSLLQRLSDSLLSQDTLSARYTVKTSTESTPLLCSGSLTPARAPGTVSSARKQSNNTRPAITRAVTEPVATTTSTSTEVSATPLLSRPSLHRAATAASAYLAFVQGQIRDVNSSRPSFLHRATNVVAASLATNLLAAHRDGDRPAAPTFWADHIHREPLLQAWDSIRDRSDLSHLEQLVRTENRMLGQFGELGSWDVVLTEEWITYVLSTCLCNPFGEGRWQKLATAAGPRGNWGPW